MHESQSWDYPRDARDSILSIFQTHPAFGAAVGEEAFVGLERFREGCAPRGQGTYIQRASPHQLQTRLEIALLGPAYVPDRIIRGGPLIGRVVATRSVAAGIA